MSGLQKLHGIRDQRFVSAADWSDDFAFAQNDFHFVMSPLRTRLKCCLVSASSLSVKPEVMSDFNVEARAHLRPTPSGPAGCKRKTERALFQARRRSPAASPLNVSQTKCSEILSENLRHASRRSVCDAFEARGNLSQCC